VIVGGGVGGASVAFHLAERGQTDVLVLERAELTSGSTFHSAGLVGQLRADPALTRMNMYSVELYRRLRDGEDQLGWTECGGIKLAASTQRLEEIRRQIGWARSFGLPLQEISAAEAQQLFPLMDTTGVLGAAYLTSDGYLDPAQLCYALMRGARRMGVRVAERTRVLGFDVRDGRVAAVRTDRGDVSCEIVVDCGGMYAAEIGRLAGVRIPIVPMSHQYVITEAFLGAATAAVAAPGVGQRSSLPTLRDPDLLVYFRQEVDGLVMGGYERNPAPWTAGPTSYDEIPPDFNGKLLPEDWARMEEIATNAQRRVPALASIGVRKVINGPEGFTPDNEFCLGETSVAGFYVAAGFCAHGIAGAGGIGQVMAAWIIDGEPGLDLWHMDVNRFGNEYRSPGYTLARVVENYQSYYDIPYPNLQRRSGRPLRTSPAYAWHAGHGAQFGEKAGWERVDWYEANATRVPAGAAPVPGGWARRYWSPAIAAEHLGTRAAVGLFDESSFAKFEVRGPDAAELLEWACGNRVARDIGAVTYTQALNRRGGIESDFTVTRVAEDRFWIVTGTAFGTHDQAWLSRQARRRGVRLTVEDVTGRYCCYAVWGPAARRLIASLTPADMSHDAFGFMSAQDIPVGDVPVRALRVTFVGELGWELYASPEYGRRLWQQLVDAGREFDAVAGGYLAIDSMRLEKGYRVWGRDITPETTPYEAGLGFAVKLDKPGGFCGREALVSAKEHGLTRRLCALILGSVGGEAPVCTGSEPVRVGPRVLGRVTSGGIGYTLGAAIAYAYLPVEVSEPGTEVEVEFFGRWIPATVTRGPLFDPTGSRVVAEG
jgi:4-methylaminobutanoate oxidase (formaldehyde-forming)